jgi:hypothetical protein
MRGAIPPLLKYFFMAWYLVKHRDKFTLLYFTLLYFTLLYRSSSYKVYVFKQKKDQFRSTKVFSNLFLISSRL